MKIISVVGARPNFMKIAPFVRAIEAHNRAIRSSERGGDQSCVKPLDTARGLRPQDSVPDCASPQAALWTAGDMSPLSASGGLPAWTPANPLAARSGMTGSPSAPSPQPSGFLPPPSSGPQVSGLIPQPSSGPQVSGFIPHPSGSCPQPSGLIEHILVHTGQHYDDRMSRAFFEELGIPDADINLGIGSGTHAEQVGRTMIAFEKVVREHRPDWVVVVGDVNATCACSITAKKEHVRLAHIEAGLRSGDMDMPEEINRLVTDRLSDLLFTPDRLSSANLRAEGVPEERIRFVGNIMIDTLEANRAKAAALDIDAIIAANLLDGGRGRCPQTPAGGRRDSPRSPLDLACGDAAGMRPQEAGLAAVSPHASNGESEGTRSLGGGTQSEASNDPPREGLLSAQREGAGPRLSPLSTAYAVMTMHRPSNVDQAETLVPIMEFLLQEVAQEMPLLWPIHPRARKQLEAFGLWPRVLACENLVLLEPLGYLEMLRLNLGARVMLTDSGGLQEECCVLGTPCLTLRWNTERPITLAEHGGASVLVGNDVARMRQAYRAAVSQDRRPSCPELWDGHAAERIVAALVAAG